MKEIGLKDFGSDYRWKVKRYSSRSKLLCLERRTTFLGFKTWHNIGAQYIFPQLFGGDIEAAIKDAEKDILEWIGNDTALAEYQGVIK